MPREYVVRVVLFEEADASVGRLIECFRYAGFVARPRRDLQGVGTLTFDMICPVHTKDTKAWADANAERMQTLGFNAVSAPMYE
jgi:hypothetical protein